MSVIKRLHRKNYTVITNDILNNHSIPWDSLGLLVYLIGLPHDWEVNVVHLVTLKDSKTKAINRMLNDLISAGYVYRYKNGFQGCWDYVVVDEPLTPEEFKLFLRTMPSRNNSVTEQFRKEQLLSKQELLKEKKQERETKDEEPTIPLISFGKHVKLKQEDYDNFYQKHGKDFMDDIIETLNDKIDAGEAKVPTNYAAKLRIWIKNRKKWDAEDKKTAIIKPTSNIEFAKKVKEKFKNNREIEIGDQAIVFIGGQCPLVIKYTDYCFKELVLNRLRKMNLSTEGLS